MQSFFRGINGCPGRGIPSNIPYVVEIIVQNGAELVFCLCHISFRNNFTDSPEIFKRL